MLMLLYSSYLKKYNNKRPMGNIAHLKKQFQEIITFAQLHYYHTKMLTLKRAKTLSPFRELNLSYL